MDFLFCLPVLFGCQTKISPEGDQTARVCPRCHNAAVSSVKSKKWFEICFVPLIPMSSRHEWRCSICQWTVPTQQAWEPSMVSHAPLQPGMYYGAQPGWQPSHNGSPGQHIQPPGYHQGPGQYNG
ncbi:hypothetical protein B0H34DRAFT_694269 [Crassisporium funariophilum]|nr:hypothetical protein B0H34DRAFT_694269 [Crassisporium funariophilum]